MTYAAQRSADLLGLGFESRNGRHFPHTLVLQQDFGFFSMLLKRLIESLKRRFYIVAVTPQTVCFAGATAGLAPHVSA